jgi:nucleoside-diphosphate-sugar epimerase
MHSKSLSIAVVGAAGFVGRALLRQLEQLGLKSTTVVRGHPELSIDGDFHVALSRSNAHPKDGFDVVINLAYPTSGKPYEHPDHNAAIAKTVEGLIKHGGRLIQVSTLAVFGMALERAVSARPVAEVRDDPYVESKITAERLFIEMQTKFGLSLDIVRLGNVWGYASGTWAVPVVQRLLTGRPVGIAGSPGYSNTTDVSNVASYLGFLTQNTDHAVGVRYHHLAEFSDVRWNEWIAPLAEALGVAPVSADPSMLGTPESGARELIQVLRLVGPRSVYKRLATQRIMGSWTRTLIRQLPAPAQARLKTNLVFATDLDPEPGEQTLLSIMAGRQEFRSVVASEWIPVLTQEQSLDQVLLWLDRG